MGVGWGPDRRFSGIFGVDELGSQHRGRPEDQLGLPSAIGPPVSASDKLDDVSRNDSLPTRSNKLALLGMMVHHTSMAKAKVAVTLESGTLKRLDMLVSTARFANRSQAIEAAVEEKLQQIERRRLAEECAKLDPDSEQALAEVGLEEDAAAWPRY